MKNNRIQESNIVMNKQLKDLPPSIYIDEKFKEQEDLFTRKPQPEKVIVVI